MPTCLLWKRGFGNEKVNDKNNGNGNEHDVPSLQLSSVPASSSSSSSSWSMIEARKKQVRQELEQTTTTTTTTTTATTTAKELDAERYDGLHLGDLQLKDIHLQSDVEYRYMLKETATINRAPQWNVIQHIKPFASHPATHSVPTHPKESHNTPLTSIYVTRIYQQLFEKKECSLGDYLYGVPLAECTNVV
ncbi:hypothetical protein RFI_13326, partial [Reticulomyxa filosa]